MIIFRCVFVIIMMCRKLLVMMQTQLSIDKKIEVLINQRYFNVLKCQLIKIKIIKSIIA
jgi:hypothetical protein